MNNDKRILPLAVSLIALAIITMLYLISKNIILLILLILMSLITLISAIITIKGDINDQKNPTTNTTPYVKDTTITFDDLSSTLIVTKGLVSSKIKYDTISSYEILIDNKKVVNPSLTGAVVGNMMYGTNGMILGALLGATHDEYINSLSVKLYLTNNTYYIIPIITKKTLKSSKEYKEKANTLDWLVNKLDEIKEHC